MFLVKREFFPFHWHKVLGLLQNTVRSLSYSIKYLEVRVVAVWQYINKPETELNIVSGANIRKCILSELSGAYLVAMTPSVSA